MANETDRCEFAAALLATSAICCFGYAFGGSLLAKLDRSNLSVRVFDFTSGVFLSAVSCSLIISLVSGSI